jgi:hypothetical protein
MGVCVQQTVNEELGFVASICTILTERDQTVIAASRVLVDQSSRATVGLL